MECLAGFNAQAILAPCRWEKATAQLAPEFDVYSIQIMAWKMDVVEGAVRF